MFDLLFVTRSIDCDLKRAWDRSLARGVSAVAYGNELNILGRKALSNS